MRKALHSACRKKRFELRSFLFTEVRLHVSMWYSMFLLTKNLPISCGLKRTHAVCKNVIYFLSDIDCGMFLLLLKVLRYCVVYYADELRIGTFLGRRNPDGIIDKVCYELCPENEKFVPVTGGKMKDLLRTMLRGL